ncbi:MAG: EVE domain-containing protein [Myxococcales bacterium]
MRHWLLKSEPSVYAFDRLVAEGSTRWDGVRNFAARNHLRAMKAGDLCLFYHSGEGKAVVGVARIRREAYPDPTAKGEDWSAVDVEPVAALAEPVTLAAIKADPALARMVLVRQGRLSVSPVEPAEFARVLALGKTPLP